MSIHRLIPLAIATGLLAAACGGGQDTTTASSTSSTSAAPPETSAVVTSSEAPTVETVVHDLAIKPTVAIPGGDPPGALVTEDLVLGEGEEAVPGSLVQVHYVGVRFSDGAQFDASWDRDQTFEFELGGGQVIQGWDQGVAGMRVGGRRQLTIPPALAYGDRGAGEAIPPGAALIFVVDLIAIVPPFPVPQLTETGGVLIANQGGDFEGNIQWFGEGAGPGLFVGDELSPAFPTDDGIEFFLTFNIEAIEIPADAGIVSAILTSRAMQVAGTPFDSLGSLIASPVDYDLFPPVGDDREPIGDGVVCEPNVEEARLACDVTAAMIEALDGGRTRASFRFRFAEPSDADGEADVAVFFIRDPNLNERGIFTLEIEFG